ncbi:hypothetical protein D9758_007486 [Tetrapyrgos nigripes]|uniref:Uncharacterized protein n=1 Tax=Tetrapyrgos nigripes TaxID=182062 RepID=A0A8H5G3N2_9AGAR|nr:hypothetical protein D9758_007486 [Tetrapyrgos nigripes]
MLKRSKMSPLYFQAIAMEHFTNSNTMHVIATVLQRQISQIGVLTMRISVGYLKIQAHEALLALRESAPLLRTIKLAVVSDFLLYNNWGNIVEAELNKTLDALQATGALQRRNRMTIESAVGFCKRSGLLKNLTSLKISHSRSNHAPSLHQLCVVLSHMRGLEFLDLKDVLPAPDAVVSSIEGVYLARLRHIRLEGDAEARAGFLDHISFPLAIEMDSIYCGSDYDTQFIVLSSLSKIRSRLSESTGLGVYFTLWISLRAIISGQRTQTQPPLPLRVAG